MIGATVSVPAASPAAAARTAVVVCGALAREVAAIALRRGWRLDLYPVPARHHLVPARIVAAVDERLGRLAGRYRRIVVVYGDCGTAGALDRVLARHRAVRPAGPHCYAMLAGCSAERLDRQIPETYFFTDYLVRSWEATVLRDMGLDARPQLKELCFGGFRRLLYLRQSADRDLLAKARRIAAFLDLPLEVWDVGLEGLEARLAEVMEEV